MAWSARRTWKDAVGRLVMRALKGTSSAVLIFHSTFTVGALWPSSIWPSMARETPESLESFSSERPRLHAQAPQVGPQDRREMLPGGGVGPLVTGDRAPARARSGAPRGGFRPGGMTVYPFRADESVNRSARNHSARAALCPGGSPSSPTPTSATCAARCAPRTRTRPGPSARRRPPTSRAAGRVRAIDSLSSPPSEVIPSTRGEPLLWAGLPGLAEACGARASRSTSPPTGPSPGGREGWARILCPVSSDVKISWGAASPWLDAELVGGRDPVRALADLRTFVRVRDETRRVRAATAAG